MNRHWTAILIAILAVMLSGIVMAVFRLYRPSAQEGKEQVTGDYTLLKAVPMDAVAVFSFDGSRASRRPGWPRARSRAGARSRSNGGARGLSGPRAGSECRADS